MIRMDAHGASTRVARTVGISLALVGAYFWAVERAAGFVGRR